MHALPLRITGWDMAFIPGDLGDARFNMYVLEHGYQWLTGQVAHYWDAPSMWPEKGIIARSDNLLGTMPLYAILRIMGLDTHSAIQGWFLMLCALNFAAAVYAFRQWGLPLALAGIGAYVFAFGLFNVGQLYHFQVFPRFCLPLILLWGFRYLRTQETRHLVLLSVAVVYQFYCGIYLGFFGLYALLVLFASHMLLYRDVTFFKNFRRRAVWLSAVLCAAGGAALLYILIAPYAEVGQSIGMRSYAEVVDSIPRPISYFFAHPSSALWSPVLYSHSSYTFNEWWLHFLFPGALPWLGVLVALWVVLRKRTIGDGRDALRFWLTALVLSMLFSLRFGDFSGYYGVYHLPGFSSMRAVVRIVNLQVLFILMPMLWAFTILLKRKSGLRYLLPVLAVLCIADQWYDLTYDVRRFEKQDALALLSRYSEALQGANMEGKEAVLIALPEHIKPDHDRVIEHHISAMLACQAAGLVCVNGYSGSYPDHYMGLFDHTDTQRLEKWCAYKGVDPERVAWVSLNGE